MTVTQELDEWEDSRNIARRRQWFSVEDALAQLSLHKPVQRHYLQQLRYSKRLGRNLTNSTSEEGEEEIFRHDDDTAFLRHDAELGNNNKTTAVEGEGEKEAEEEGDEGDEDNRGGSKTKKKKLQQTGDCERDDEKSSTNEISSEGGGKQQPQDSS